MQRAQCKNWKRRGYSSICMVRLIVVVLCCVVLCWVVLGWVVLGSHFVYSVRGKGYATVECWGGQVAIVVNNKNQNSTGRWIGECACGGAVESYRAPGIEILKETRLVAPNY